MPTRIQRSALVPYSTEQMFALVNGIEAYPEFLPFCRSASILTAHHNQVTAKIELAKGALHKTFTTRNSLQPPNTIQMDLIDGPFRRLNGAWSFHREGVQRTRVSLNLEFEFSSRFMALALGPIFTPLANSMVDAFVRRARQVYGGQHG